MTERGTCRGCGADLRRCDCEAREREAEIARLALDAVRTFIEWRENRMSASWDAHGEASDALTKACRRVLDEEKPKP